ncbi:MAG: hypothetical protein RTU30_13005 [Candidatus Thorarchaeota archaeon]
MSKETTDPKILERRYHLERREKGRRIVCDVICCTMVIVFVYSAILANMVEGVFHVDIYYGLLPYAFVAVLTIIAWIVYRSYSRQLVGPIRD